MSLFRSFRDWSHRTSPAAGRTARRFEHTAVEELESRLCLGGLTPPPITPAEFEGAGSVAAAVATFESGVDDSVDADLATAIERPSGEPAGTHSTTGEGTPAGTPTTSPSGDLATGLDIDVFANASGLSGPGVGGEETVGGPVADTGSDSTDVAGGQVTALVDTASSETGADGFTTAAEQALASADALSTRQDEIVSGEIPWWLAAEHDTVVRYDFRDHDGWDNLITDEQQVVAEAALDAWSDATDGRVVFVRDTAAGADQIVNIGVGDLAAHGGGSVAEGTLGLGGGQLELAADGSVLVRGSAWLDAAENWDVQIGNGHHDGSFDFFTVVAHELGHTLGYDDAVSNDSDIMHGTYGNERSAAAVQFAALNGNFYTQPLSPNLLADEVLMRPLVSSAPPQLQAAEVNQLLDRASAATSSRDAIIAIVDRGGRILGIRVEDGVSANITGNVNNLVFAIDGALAKARTAAFFSSNVSPLTSRVVQFLAQSTITQREVEANPNVGLVPTTAATAPFVGGAANPALVRDPQTVLESTVFGPGYVAPIAIGGHFPPEVPHTPVADLFAVEHKDRDSLINPGPDGIKGTADDILLTDRLNATFAGGASGVTRDPNLQIEPPESYGFQSGLLPFAQNRGLGTLPGGIPIFRDTDGNGFGDFLVGGIGVFFPGEDGYATFEQNFIPGIGQTQFERQNAPRALEAEYIAFAALGGSNAAAQTKAAFVQGARIGDIAGVAPVNGIDLLFGRIDLVGITLPVLGPIAGREGVERLLAFGNQLGPGEVNGFNAPFFDTVPGTIPTPADPLVETRNGRSLPDGFLVPPQDGNGVTAAEVQDIISRSIAAADRVRSAIRVPFSSGTRMIHTVVDLDGQIVGLFRQPDALFDAFDVTIAKARNVAYYANPAEIQDVDQVAGVPDGAALTGRTFRFLAEPRYPVGVDGSTPAPFSTLLTPGINPATAENIGAPLPAFAFDPALSPGGTVLGYDAFFPSQNFHDPDDPQNQNGVIFFHGNTPIYRNGVLIGGLGVSGDGVDQDDTVTFLAAHGFIAPDNLRADNFFVRDVRLPFIKFFRNPTGNVFPFG